MKKSWPINNTLDEKNAIEKVAEDLKQAKRTYFLKIS